MPVEPPFEEMITAGSLNEKFYKLIYIFDIRWIALNYNCIKSIYLDEMFQRNNMRNVAHSSE